MAYIRPQDVTSPVEHLTGPVTVLLDGGEGECSVASFIWDDVERVGMRWNGHGDKRNGNPFSRQPTWFVLPEELEALRA